MNQSYIQQGDSNETTLHGEYRISRSPATRHLINKDAAVYLHQALSTPVMNVIAKTEGAYLHDYEGNKYLDLHGNGVHNIGFNNQEVIDAVSQQLKAGLSFVPRRYTNEPAVAFAEQLTAVAPAGLDRVLFCPGGSEAVEMAILLAKQVTGKWKTISFWDNYHGTTFQAATVGGTEHFTTGNGPMVPGAFHVEFPNYYRNPFGLSPDEKEKIDDLYIRSIEVILKRHPDVAAIVGTTITSTPNVPTSYFWQRIRHLCDHHGIFLIFDEIVCGLGRTGKLFACEYYVTPDVVVLGKSLGGGIMPFAGILTHEKHNVLQHRSIGHFTHEKNPLCCAAGLAALEFIEQNSIVQHAGELGDYFKNELNDLKGRYPVIGHVEGRGLLLCADIVEDKTTKQRAPGKASKIMYHCLKNGLSFKVIDGNVLTFRPSLIIEKSEVDFIIATLENAVRTVL
ncbi:MAG: aspartate aminotransferase family protein [Bacteroidota bacterium]